MEKYELTFEVGTLDNKKIIVSGNSYADVERRFNRTIGLQKITNIKLIE
jgi:hypothetical protein